jgi:hypothetical protein
MSDYFAMLLLLGRVFQSLKQHHGVDAVLVGGAAVEFYTGGRYQTGDFDVVFEDFALFGSAMSAHGFAKPSGIGRLLRGWVHPDFPDYGIELVSGALFDGLSDRSRCRLIRMGEASAVALPPIEDLIADRLGQYCAIANNPDRSCLEQAKLLFLLAETIDKPYLEKRVQDEGGDMSLLLGSSLDGGQ